MIRLVYNLVAKPLWLITAYAIIMAWAHHAVIYSDDPAVREAAFWVSNAGSFMAGLFTGAFFA